MEEQYSSNKEVGYGEINSGYEHEVQFSNGQINTAKKYTVKKTIKGNQIGPSSLQPRSNSKQFKRFSSVVGFRCCKSNQKVHYRTKSESKHRRESCESLEDTTDVFYIYGKNIATIPDLISSHSSLNEENETVNTHSNADLDKGPSIEYPIIDNRDGCSSNACLFICKHIRQEYSWDCGVSCIMMVLTPMHRKYFRDHFSLLCEQEGFKTSTWTIDLAYLLHRFSVPFRYYTITLGVDPGLTKEKFYQAAVYKDAMRVVDRFRYADTHGLKVQKESISIDSILSHLQTGLPIIVLTNAQLLFCSTCNNNPSSTFRNCFAGTCGTPFQGHYIVLAGYDAQNDVIYYKNPSSNNSMCQCSLGQLQDARLCYGTDEDIIFIDCDSAGMALKSACVHFSIGDDIRCKLHQMYK